MSDEESLTNLETSLIRACTIRNATLLIAGDFNFSGWDWKSKTLKSRTTHTSLHQKFSEILDNNGLTQLVEEPTRKTSTLDLTNQPGKVLRVDIIPGISDHDVVFVEFDLRPVKYKQKPRPIPLYKRANWDGIPDFPD